MKLAHIIATRNSPVPEIVEVFCPADECGARVLRLRWSWDTVFIYRLFHATERVS